MTVNLQKLKRNMPLHMMMLPGMLLLLIYHYLPMLGIVMAFQKFIPAKGFFKSKWVGLGNYLYMINMPNIGQVIFNTLSIAIWKIVIDLIVAITFALLLNEISNRFTKRSIQTCVYLPHFISWVILSGIVIDILSPSFGMINSVVKLFNNNEGVFFLGSNKWFPFVIVVTHVWKEFGYKAILYLATLTSIDPNLYEAAQIDGANRWKQTIHITLPGISPVIILTSLLSLGSILNAGFEQIFNLYNPLVYKSGDIIDTLVYRIGLQQINYSLSAAIGLFKSVVSFSLIITSRWLAKKLADYNVL